MRVVKYGNDNVTNLPVSGAGSDVKVGALLKPGVTAGTDLGSLVLQAANSTEGVGTVGILREKHVFGTSGDTTNTGVSFVTHPVQLIVPGRVVRIPYSLASADLITASQAVTTTTMTLTSQETSIDGSFLYVVSGTGAGQTNYITASASTWTLKAAFGTSLDTTSKFIKILRRFHTKMSLTSDGTSLSSQAAVGVHDICVIDIFIERNGDRVQMNPATMSALTGLNGLRTVGFSADVMFRNTFPYTFA